MHKRFQTHILPGTPDWFPHAQPLILLLTLQSWRDQQLHAHAERVSELAQALSARLGCSASDKALIGLAALVHDIGKLVLPDILLQKDIPLVPEEWSWLRCHPELARHFLEQAGGVCAVLAPLVASHHERWDGLGYPQRLRGEQIPLGARILSIADAYDVMTHNRPYHQAMPWQTALRELEQAAGSQFDPHLVAQFVSLQERNVS